MVSALADGRASHAKVREAVQRQAVAGEDRNAHNEASGEIHDRIVGIRE